MSEMKNIYSMVKDGSYKEFVRTYHNTLANERELFMFQEKLYTIEKAEAITLLVQDTLKKL